MNMCQNVGHGKSHWDTVSFRRNNKDCTWFQFGLRHPHVAKTYCFFSGVVINDAGYNASVFHPRFYHDNNFTCTTIGTADNLSSNPTTSVRLKSEIPRA